MALGFRPLPLGPVTINGSLAKTLGALTSSATAKVQVKGTLSKTLGALTSSATGKVQVKGALAKTLGSLTLDADGTVANAGTTGTLSKTLGNLTLTATGAVQVKGAFSKTLATVTSVATGTVTAGAVAPPATDAGGGPARRRRRVIFIDPRDLPPIYEPNYVEELEKLPPKRAAKARHAVVQVLAKAIDENILPEAVRIFAEVDLPEVIRVGQVDIDGLMRNAMALRALVAAIEEQDEEEALFALMN